MSASRPTRPSAGARIAKDLTILIVEHDMQW